MWEIRHDDTGRLMEMSCVSLFSFKLQTFLWNFCALVQLLRWLADSDMAGLSTAGLQVSSCTYCKLWQETWREKIVPYYITDLVLIWYIDFFDSQCSFPLLRQAVRQPSFLRWNRWWWLWKPWQEPVPKDPGRRLWVWLSVLGWYLWFR